MSKLGERIRQARKHRGLSGEQLGALIGSNQSTISDWEKGKHSPRMTLLGSLAEALGVNLEWLISGEGEMEKTEKNGRDFPDRDNSTSRLRDLEAPLNPKEVGNRIKEARAGYPNVTYGVEPTGISQGELAEKIGVDPSLVSKWESGERVPAKEQLEPLAVALGVKLKWLSYGEGDKNRYLVPESDQIKNVTEGWREIPILGCVPGGDPFAPELVPEGSMMILTSISKHPRLFGLNVRGDSMAPKIEDGDQVAIEPIEGEPPPGSIVVALIDGETTCKIFRRTGQGRPVLIPLNPIVEPIFLNVNDRILGVVVLVQKTLKPL